MLDRLRALCLALPEAAEKTTWDIPTFRVRDKIFAMAHDPGTVWCKAPRGVQAILVEAAPDRFIAQELVHLSTAPTEVGEGRLAPRHVDLRPFAVFGDEIRIVPGGLTRVALEEGSMIVNSSAGGGSKDTWVLATARSSESGFAPERQGAPPLTTPARGPELAAVSRQSGPEQ